MSNMVAVIIDNIHPIEPIIAVHEPFLPKGCDIWHIKNEPIYSIQDYNKLLTSRIFWRNMPEKVIIFQHDSGLLRYGIESFLGWDYVGAPWKFQQHGGNGGLSVRSRDTMLNVIKNVPWDGQLNEDVYFCNAIKELGMNMAKRDVCFHFSVESIFTLGTVGYHDIDQWLTSDQCNQIKNQYVTN